MAITEDPGELRQIIEDDLRSAFERSFSGLEVEIPAPFEDLLPIGNGDATAVPWRITGTHTDTFHDVRATGFPIEVTGATFLLDGGGSDPRFIRIVDWHTLYRQLGLLMVCRRPQTPETADADDADQPSTVA